jgi:ribonuclease HII
MTKAWRVAAERALAGLAVVPDALLVDGPSNLLRRPQGEEGGFAGHVRPVVRGDARCASVAAASVLAKVVRDRWMRQEAEHFPAYGFERNKGYPSPRHQMALQGYGLSAVHRRWAYIEDLAWTDWQPRPRRLACDQDLEPSNRTCPE